MRVFLVARSPAGSGPAPLTGDGVGRRVRISALPERYFPVDHVSPHWMDTLDLIRDQLHKCGTWRSGELVDLEFSVVVGIGRFEALLHDGQGLVFSQRAIVIWVVALELFIAEVTA